MKCVFVLIFITLFSAAVEGKSETDFQLSPFDATTQGRLFTIAGSNTIGAHLAPEWARAFLTQKGAIHVGITSLPTENEFRVEGYNGDKPVYIDLHAHGSSTSFQSLHEKRADIAMSSRAIKTAERDQLRYLGDLTQYSSEHVVAIDGLAIIVHPKNPLSDLSTEQIAKLFSGEIQNWQMLGGADQPVNIYARDHKSGTWDTFKSLVLQSGSVLTKSAVRFESNDALSDAVAADRGGIGFVGLASVRQAKALAVTSGAAAAIKPKHLYVATEDYPLARRLYLYTPHPSINPYVDEFVHFAQGQRGQKMVEDAGFVSQNPVRLNVAIDEGPMFYRTLAAQAQRLSVNFRFQPGKAELDNKAKRDVWRLAQYLKSSGNQNLHIQLVGFSNKRGDSGLSTVLSRLRATAVKMELFRYGVHTETIEGYGADRMVADDQGHAGQKNDRVEVWVYPPDVNEVLQRLKHGVAPVSSRGYGRPPALADQ